MRWNDLLIPTRKAAPQAKTAAGLRGGWELLARAGLLHLDRGDRRNWLPLGVRALRRLRRLIGRETAALGGQEVALHGLAPAGPGVAAMLAAQTISYRQLPLLLYGDQPPGAGAAASRGMFAALFQSAAGDGASRPMREACGRVLFACGIETVAAQTDNGHSLLWPSDAGERRFVDDGRGYVALPQDARIAERSHSFGGEAADELQPVHTPEMTTVAEVARLLGARSSDLLKTLVFKTTNPEPPLASGVNPRFLVAVVRGDHEVSLSKLRRAARRHFHVEGLAAADDPRIGQTWPVGFVGPSAAVKRPDTVVLIDPDAAQPRPWIAGADERDHHVRNFNWFRECGQNLADPKKIMVADIRLAREGDASPGGGVLRLRRGVELARVEDTATELTAAAGAVYRDEQGRPRLMHLILATVDLEAIIAAAARVCSDERGLSWPAALAPVDVVITPVQYAGNVRAAAERIYGDLAAAGIETILDDRDARAGAKFADADLIGFPLRITIGERSLKQGQVELKARLSGQSQLVGIDAVVDAVREALGRDRD